MPTTLTPDPNSGFYETPYIYSKVYSQATTGSISGATGNYPDVIPSDGDSDFFLRRAVNCYNFKDAASQDFIAISPTGLQLQATAPGFDMPIAPEKLYPLGTNIPILMQTNNGVILPTVASLVYPATAAVNIAIPCFQGVKRRKGAANATPNYPYYEKPYSYPLYFAQNWTYLVSPYSTLAVAAAKTFVVNVLNWDFELQCLEFNADFINNNSGQNTYSGYMVKLYDANGYALMSDFVHYRQLSYLGGFVGNTKTSASAPGDALPWYPNCYPVPPIIYPKGGQIRIDIVSLLDTSTTGGGSSINQTIHFRGVNRMPC